MGYYFSQHIDTLFMKLCLRHLSDLEEDFIEINNIMTEIGINIEQGIKAKILLLASF